ncbi:hypothetical protein HK098_004982 [Nowakowskiella sp. JEL0407]|nr:hypothetical protein HK098_004982 [Nowakowskiella sp. JEL0407]
MSTVTLDTKFNEKFPVTIPVPLNWADFAGAIYTVHNIPATTRITVTYNDKMGDEITLDTTLELSSLLQRCGSSPPTFNVKIAQDFSKLRNDNDLNGLVPPPTNFAKVPIEAGSSSSVGENRNVFSSPHSSQHDSSSRAIKFPAPPAPPQLNLNDPRLMRRLLKNYSKDTKRWTKVVRKDIKRYEKSLRRGKHGRGGYSSSSSSDSD